MRRHLAVLVLATAALVVAGCEADSGESVSTSAVGPHSTVTVGSTPTSTSTVTVYATPATTELPVETTPPLPIVTEGSLCASRGSIAVFADGATAYCARLQYTDALAWSRDPDLAPNPTPPVQTPVGPSIGDTCIGADIGRTATDSNGTAIVCDNYVWVPNVGQTPRHPWADNQTAWTECIKTHTTDECREMLNGGG
ncbi:hypothetical protein [Gordonia sp. NB41Y]|uniref:hypothetical protein n=1 Tax=Gordonia sp. NB41Y TaxID=875808 RepID=UPI0021C955CC|nr:hypothetical protein [Gordonia sp. NB41Y]WLP92187.1 hypothetical protein Q9K23_08140 [Gordonia sp. NB41Y]